MVTNNSSVPAGGISKEIRAIYEADRTNAGTSITAYLELTLKGYTPAEKLSAIENIAHQFDSTIGGASGPGFAIEEEGMSKMISLLLGKDIPLEKLPSRELMEKLSHSLNTVFDSLNQIIRVINTTLLGQKVELETIRKIIGSDLESREEQDSLQGYLDQIQEAFLVAHRAFQVAAADKIGKLLDELDPAHISEKTEKSLKFGPLRKAEHFDIYTEKYEACRKWFDSGRFSDELLREFEKVCQKLYKKKARSME